MHDKKKLYKAEQIGIVCPVFGHEVPSLVKEFLAQSIFKTDYFYLVLTYGNRHGGNATLVELPKLGIKGNTHFLMSDLNNQQLVDLLDQWLKKNIPAPKL